MFKNIISPVQAWLLSRGQCVGCGAVIANGQKTQKKDGSERFICKCGRVYIYEPKANKYRRALFEEV
jgi:hypothetical protein